ncbi:MAG: Rrf2 family transcriptional regulator [Planctomycetota bacterium]
MANLSQGTGYAVQALAFVAAAAGKPMLVRTIAERCDLPAAFLAKVVNRLGKAGLVHTQRGINGGVTLTQNPDEITLFEVCQALEDPIVERRCILGVSECSDERACPAHEFHCSHRAIALEFLRNTTVADVAAFETSRSWGGQSQSKLTLNGSELASVDVVERATG